MEKQRILIVGGSGFIGTALQEHWRKQESGYDVRCVSARAGGLNALPADFCPEVVINLAGAPISRGWNAAYKGELLRSRLTATHQTIEYMGNLPQRPRVFCNASAVGFYGSFPDAESQQRLGSQPASGFLPDLCRQWEAEAMKAKDYAKRICLLRIGVVLGRQGGALPKMLPPFHLGLGGKIGHGQQVMSWISLSDTIRAIDFLIQRETELQGAITLTAPQPVTNAEFSRTLARTLKRPAFFPVPAFVVSTLFGEMGRTILLSGQKALPEELLAAGFRFSHPKLERALASILHSQA